MWFNVTPSFKVMVVILLFSPLHVVSFCGYGVRPFRYAHFSSISKKIVSYRLQSSPNADQPGAGESVIPGRSESVHRSRKEPNELPQTNPLPSSSMDSMKTDIATTSITSIATVSTSAADDTRSHTTITATALLQRPWADRLLAAARSQQDSTRDNAQVKFTFYHQQF